MGMSFILSTKINHNCGNIVASIKVILPNFHPVLLVSNVIILSSDCGSTSPHPWGRKALLSPFYGSRNWDSERLPINCAFSDQSLLSKKLLWMPCASEMFPLCPLVYSSLKSSDRPHFRLQQLIYWHSETLIIVTTKWTVLSHLTSLFTVKGRNLVSQNPVRTSFFFLIEFTCLVLGSVRSLRAHSARQ